MDLDADLLGILNLLRRHIEIRNRSWMKRIHRDCFIGSEAIDFLVTQGLVDTRDMGVVMCRNMVARKLIRPVTQSSQKFSDSYHYYRFHEDDADTALLSSTRAGNGTVGAMPGQGGCRWSFCPHTAHNSYILDIAQAEEIERAVAGASVESRLHSVQKLRSRVREQSEETAPDWLLSQSTEVNNTMISLYLRKRPRGDWKNVKMTGMVGETPVGFIKGIMSFQKRKQWESSFEDGVMVEGIDLGEQPSVLLEDDDGDDQSKTPPKVEEEVFETSLNIPSLPDSTLASKNANVARATDDVMTFLETVDLAGVPNGMAIGFLNDPERQHALAHLRKQMMLSNPQECMLCQGFFESSADIRCCPCCAMVCCASCVRKRVFEVVSRSVVSVCVHCYRESSRIRQPPQAVTNTKEIDESLRGKWWRPEELGIVDYSTSMPSAAEQPHTGKEGSLNSNSTVRGARESVSGGRTSLYNDQDVLVRLDNITPLVPGLLDGIDVEEMSKMPAPAVDEDDTNTDIEAEAEEESSAVSSPIGQGTGESSTKNITQKQTVDTPKTARCKRCGMLISRDMEAIEAHMEECDGMTVTSGAAHTNDPDQQSYMLNALDGSVVYSPGTSKLLAGVTRKPDLEKRFGTKIVYRSARNPQNPMVRPREVCAFQDSFVDPDGTCYVYEISVRHSDVMGLPDYTTCDCMLLMYVARPVKGSKLMSSITIISQVDTKSRSPQWLLSFLGVEAGRGVGRLHRDDLVRELKMTGNLQNMLREEQESTGEQCSVSLNDFELLAVLGRGGFGKVMQVRHRPTDEVFAMKILKKSELRRRRQVERTQTERTILANVRHPFIVCLHYAFQNNQKLYMVMDFVQGGDFFTFMRKLKRIPEDWVRLYVIEVAMALQHLHDMDVVYRDLKPENILLCGDGHLKLTDFGLSRFFETRPPAPEDMLGDDDVVTRSFCGTEQYMSPEMLLQQGHNFRMDWWCLGLLMHEMITARHPFHGPTHYDTLRNMVTRPPNIDHRCSPAAGAVVKSFLVKNPKARLCCKNGIAEMKNIPYFGIIDWDALYHRRIDMPYKPKLVGNLDLSSFESQFTRERPVDSVPDEDGKRADGHKKAGKGGLLGLFGIGGPNPPSGVDGSQKKKAADADSFQGFSFTKEEKIANSEAATGDSVLPPPPAR